jgi:hypothetical protein
MKPRIPLIAAALIAAPLFAHVTDFSSPSTGGASVRIFVTPLRNGDVDIEIEGSQAAPALVAKTARDAMGCKWREVDHDEDTIWGVCEEWLHGGATGDVTGDVTYGEGSIQLAPLVTTLRAAGASRVNIKLWASSPPPTLPRGWRKEVVESAGFFSSKTEYFTFRSASADLLGMPPAFPVSQGDRWNAWRLAAPLYSGRCCWRSG